MTVRVIQPKSEPYGDRLRPAYNFSCSECTTIDKVVASNFAGALPQDMVIQKMRQRGWHIGKSASSDLCPACVRDHRTKRLKPTLVEAPPPPATVKALADLDKLFSKPAPEKETTMNIQTVPPAPQPPRQMSKSDQRLVFAAINDHYINENEGYEAGWDDARVAKDLGCPRAWVTDVREQHFGPAEGNPKLRAVKDKMGEIEKLVEEQRGIWAKLNTELDEIRAQIKALG